MAPRKGHIFKPIRNRLDDLSTPEPMSGCLIWLGHDNGNGYGRISIGSKHFYAHRISYELAKGQIPEGLQLDHKCRNTFCINPDHLEPVTHQENAKRGIPFRSKWVRCTRGHNLSDTKYVDLHGKRQCRECRNIRQRAYRWRKNQKKVKRAIESMRQPDNAS